MRRDLEHRNPRRVREDQGERFSYPVYYDPGSSGPLPKRRKAGGVSRAPGMEGQPRRLHRTWVSSSGPGSSAAVYTREPRTSRSSRHGYEYDISSSQSPPSFEAQREYTQEIEADTYRRENLSSDSREGRGRFSYVPVVEKKYDEKFDKYDRYGSMLASRTGPDFESSNYRGRVGPSERMIYEENGTYSAAPLRQVSYVEDDVYVERDTGPALQPMSRRLSHPDGYHQKLSREETLSLRRSRPSIHRLLAAGEQAARLRARGSHYSLQRPQNDRLDIREMNHPAASAPGQATISPRLASASPQLPRQQVPMARGDSLPLASRSSQNRLGRRRFSPSPPHPQGSPPPGPSPSPYPLTSTKVFRHASVNRPPQAEMDRDVQVSRTVAKLFRPHSRDMRKMAGMRPGASTRRKGNGKSNSSLGGKPKADDSSPGSSKPLDPAKRREEIFRKCKWVCECGTMIRYVYDGVKAGKMNLAEIRKHLLNSCAYFANEYADVLDRMRRKKGSSFLNKTDSTHEPIMESALQAITQDIQSKYFEWKIKHKRDYEWLTNENQSKNSKHKEVSEVVPYEKRGKSKKPSGSLAATSSTKSSSDSIKGGWCVEVSLELNASGLNAGMIQQIQSHVGADSVIVRHIISEQKGTSKGSSQPGKQESPLPSQPQRPSSQHPYEAEREHASLLSLPPGPPASSKVGTSSPTSGKANGHVNSNGLPGDSKTSQNAQDLRISKGAAAATSGTAGGRASEMKSTDASSQLTSYPDAKPKTDTKSYLNSNPNLCKSAGPNSPQEATHQALTNSQQPQAKTVTPWGATVDPKAMREEGDEGGVGAVAPVHQNQGPLKATSNGTDNPTNVGTTSQSEQQNQSQPQSGKSDAGIRPDSRGSGTEAGPANPRKTDPMEIQEGPSQPLCDKSGQSTLGASSSPPSPPAPDSGKLAKREKEAVEWYQPTVAKHDDPSATNVQVWVDFGFKAPFDSSKITQWQEWVSYKLNRAAYTKESVMNKVKSFRVGLVRPGSVHVSVHFDLNKELGHQEIREWVEDRLRLIPEHPLYGLPECTILNGHEISSEKSICTKARVSLSFSSRPAVHKAMQLFKNGTEIKFAQLNGAPLRVTTKAILGVDPKMVTPNGSSKSASILWGKNEKHPARDSGEKSLLPKRSNPSGAASSSSSSSLAEVMAGYRNTDAAGGREKRGNPFVGTTAETAGPPKRSKVSGRVHSILTLAARNVRVAAENVDPGRNGKVERRQSLQQTQGHSAREHANLGYRSALESGYRSALESETLRDIKAKKADASSSNSDQAPRPHGGGLGLTRDLSATVSDLTDASSTVGAHRAIVIEASQSRGSKNTNYNYSSRAVNSTSRNSEDDDKDVENSPSHDTSSVDRVPDIMSGPMVAAAEAIISGRQGSSQNPKARIHSQPHPTAPGNPCPDPNSDSSPDTSHSLSNIPIATPVALVQPGLGEITPEAETTWNAAGVLYKSNQRQSPGGTDASSNMYLPAPDQQRKLDLNPKPSPNPVAYPSKDSGPISSSSAATDANSKADLSQQPEIKPGPFPHGNPPGFARRFEGQWKATLDGKASLGCKVGGLIHVRNLQFSISGTTFVLEPDAEAPHRTVILRASMPRLHNSTLRCTAVYCGGDAKNNNDHENNRSSNVGAAADGNDDSDGSTGECEGEGDAGEGKLMRLKWTTNNLNYSTMVWERLDNKSIECSCGSEACSKCTPKVAISSQTRRDNPAATARSNNDDLRRAFHANQLERKLSRPVLDASYLLPPLPRGFRATDQEMVKKDSTSIAQ